VTIKMGAPLHQLGPRSFGSIQAGPKHVIGPLWTVPYVRELQAKLQPARSAALRKATCADRLTRGDDCSSPLGARLTT
jgi:hypothetical protein